MPIDKILSVSGQSTEKNELEYYIKIKKIIYIHNAKNNCS